MIISKHITLEEATKSDTALRHGIDNTPSENIIQSMEIVAKECFEPLREWYNKPIRVNSFYRCQELNMLVKGAANSQHVKGEAIDMDAGSKQENKKLFDWCKANLIFDQLIWEFDGAWVHISYKPGMNRNQSFDVK